MLCSGALAVVSHGVVPLCTLQLHRTKIKTLYVKVWTLLWGEAAFLFRLTGAELNGTVEEEVWKRENWFLLTRRSFQPTSWGTRHYCPRVAHIFWRSNGNHKLQLVSTQNRLSSAAEGQRNFKSFWWMCVVTCMWCLQGNEVSPELLMGSCSLESCRVPLTCQTSPHTLLCVRFCPQRQKSPSLALLSL